MCPCSQGRTFKETREKHMYEVGILNRDITRHLAEQGHTDMFMICDAGFAIPAEVPTVDISIKKDYPQIETVIKELLESFSVEKIIVSESMVENSPSKFKKVRELFGSKVSCETVSQGELRDLSKSVKFAIRTGDFTAYSNVLIVSGPGDRWYVERKL